MLQEPLLAQPGITVYRRRSLLPWVLGIICTSHACSGGFFYFVTANNAQMRETLLLVTLISTLMSVASAAIGYVAAEMNFESELAGLTSAAGRYSAAEMDLEHEMADV